MSGVRKRTSHLIALLAIFALVAAACSSDTDSDDATSSETGEESDAGTGDTEGEDAEADDAEAGGDEEAAPSGDGLDVDAVLAADTENCEEPTGDPVKIGFAADLGEVGGPSDIPASAGAQVYVDLINCAGGLDGAPVELVVRDVQGEPDVVGRVTQELLDEGVIAILGPPFTDTGTPILQTTNGETLVVFVGSTEPGLPDASANSYLTAFDDTTQATAAAEYALEQGFTTAVTMSDPSVPYFSTNNPGVFTEVFEAGGGTVVADYPYTIIDDTDFSTQVNEMGSLDAAPDVVYTAMFAFQATILRGQLAAAGMEPTFMMTDAFEATGGYGESDIDGILHTTHTIVTDGSRLAAFAEAIAAAGADGEVGDGGITFAGLGADAITNVANAYLAAGSADPAAVAAAFGELEGSVAVTATYTYAGGNGVPAKPVVLHEVVDGAPSLAAEIEIGD